MDEDSICKLISSSIKHGIKHKSWTWTGSCKEEVKMFFRVSLGQSECMSMSAFLRKRCTAALKNIEHLTRVALTKKKHLENENL